jgi:hypothetical protein
MVMKMLEFLVGFYFGVNVGFLIMFLCEKELVLKSWRDFLVMVAVVLFFSVILVVKIIVDEILGLVKKSKEVRE